MNESADGNVLDSAMRKQRLLMPVLLACGLSQWVLPADLPTIRPPDGVMSQGDRVRFLFNHNIWLDSDGNPLAIQDENELVDFLSTAEVVDVKRISIGINGIYKVLLEKDGVRIWAGYRNVNVMRPPAQHAGRVINRFFRDSAIFEVAAYRLSRMLGLNAVPPTVKRRLFHSSGTLQLWVENAMMEKKRRERGIGPVSATQRVFQLQNMKVFDALIENEDRNVGNMLWDGQWRLWMIDHTRSFRNSSVPPQLALVQACDRYLFERLRDLDRAEVEKQLGGLLSGRQLNALFKRQASLVEHLGSLVETRGAPKVLF